MPVVNAAANNLLIGPTRDAIIRLHNLPCFTYEEKRKSKEWIDRHYGDYPELERWRQRLKEVAMKRDPKLFESNKAIYAQDPGIDGLTDYERATL